MGPFPARYLSGTDHYFRWVWKSPDTPDLRWPLWFVLWSVGEILTSRKDCRRVIRCAAEGCGAFFVALNPGKPRKILTVNRFSNRQDLPILTI